MLPALDRATRGPNYTPELVPESFTDNWRRTGWGSESARYYFEHIRPYLGNLWPSSQPRARAFQVRCLVRTSFPPANIPTPLHSHSKLTMTLLRHHHTPQRLRFPTGMKSISPTAGGTNDPGASALPPAFFLLDPHRFHKEIMDHRVILCPNCDSPARLVLLTLLPAPCQFSST
jgi:hypothetical protein